VNWRECFVGMNVYVCVTDINCSCLSALSVWMTSNGSGTNKEVENYVDAVNGNWTRHLVMYQVYVRRPVAHGVVGLIKNQLMG
jgi:hypothetical protein